MFLFIRRMFSLCLQCVLLLIINPDFLVLAPLTATVRPTASTVTSQPQKPMHSTRTASIRPLIPTVTPTAMVSPTVPTTNTSASQGVLPPATRSASGATIIVAPEQRVSESQPGPSRGQASVFKAPRVLVSAQAEEGMTTNEVPVTPVISTSSTTELNSYQEVTESLDEQRQSELPHATEVSDIAQGLSSEELLSSAHELQREEVFESRCLCIVSLFLVII